MLPPSLAPSAFRTPMTKCSRWWKSQLKALVQPKPRRYMCLLENKLLKAERDRKSVKEKLFKKVSSIYEILFVQVCKRRCNRNNFDDAIFLFAWSHAFHVFQIVILRVSVEPVVIAVVWNVYFVSFLFFFLDKSFNKNVLNIWHHAVVTMQTHQRALCWKC